MKAGMVSKNRYQQCLRTYEERKQALKDKYGMGTDQYNARVAGINMKIRTWKKGIRRIEIREQKLDEINELLIDFMGCSVKHSIKEMTPMHKIARNIFFKHCLENKIKGVNGKWLSDYCGYRYRDAPGRARLEFTRSFITKKSNRDWWYSWKQFIGREQELLKAA